MFRLFRFVTISSLAVVLLLSLFLTPAARTSVSAAQSNDANKAVIRTLYNLFNKGDMAGLSAVVDAKIVDHTASPKQAAGLEGLKQGYGVIRAGFPDVVVKENTLIADGDKVADRLTATGTHKGQFMGVSPTSKPVTFDVADIYRIANGKIVEIWHIEDIAGIMFQIAPPPGQPPEATMAVPGQGSAATQAMDAATQAASGTTDIKALAARVFDTFNQDFQSGNFDNLSQYFAANFIEHSTGSGQPGGFNDLTQGFMQLHTAFPDAHYELEDVLVEGNMSANRDRFTGTQKGPFGPFPPSNKPVNYETIDFVRVEGGKVIEHWNVNDTLTLFTQIGAMPMPGQPAATMAATSASK